MFFFFSPAYLLCLLIYSPPPHTFYFFGGGYIEISSILSHPSVQILSVQLLLNPEIDFDETLHKGSTSVHMYMCIKE